MPPQSHKQRCLLIGLTFVGIILFFLAFYTCSGTSCFGITSKVPRPIYIFSNSDLDKTQNFNFEDEDVLVYLHIQKTGGSTFGRHLVHDLDFNPPCECFSGRKQCHCRTKNNRVWLFSRHSVGWKCGLHADWTELHNCVDEWFQEHDVKSRTHRRYHYITFVRNPQDRFLSEWGHVRRGATWKAARLYCNDREASLEEAQSSFQQDDKNAG